jgi:hypothetical protein
LPAKGLAGIDSLIVPVEFATSYRAGTKKSQTIDVGKGMLSGTLMALIGI